MLSAVLSTLIRLFSESTIGAPQLSFWDDNITQVANAQNKQIIRRYAFHTSALHAV